LPKDPQEEGCAHLPGYGPRKSEPIRCSININLLNECVCETILPFTEIRVHNLLPDVTHSFSTQIRAAGVRHYDECILNPPEEKKKKTHNDYPVVTEFYKPLQLPGRPKCFSLNFY